MRLRYLKEEANRLISLGKLEKALECFTEAIALDPADALLRLRHAECCRKLGRRAGAIASFIDAADLLRRQGHYARGIAALKLAMELSPGHPALAERLAHLENEKQQASLSGTGPTTYSLQSSAQAGGRLPYRTSTKAIEIDAVLTQARRALPAAPLRAAQEPEEAPVVMGVLENHPKPASDLSYPMFRRLSDRVMAIRPSAQSKWIVVSSETPVNVTLVDELPVRPATHTATAKENLLENVTVVKPRRS